MALTTHAFVSLAIGLTLHVIGAEPGDAGGPKPQARGTSQMAARLEALAQASDPQKNAYINDRRVQMLEKLLAEATAFQEKVQLQFALAYELLLAGRSEESVRTFLKIREIFSQPNLHVAAGSVHQLHELLAIAYLRLGEQQNCIARHNPDSCLMPIRGEGVHVITDPSRKAIEELTVLLKESGNDLKSRWLLNLAHMTLGEYPDKVAPEWRIDPKVFASDYDIKRFYDVAAQTGVDINGLSGGCITEDLDGDGYIDIVASSWGLLDQLHYLHNDADGTFSDRTAEAGLVGETGGLNICHADYDNDGRPDLLVLRGAWLRDQGRLPNSLLRNRGDGTFEDVTEQAGLLSFHPTQTAAWADFDNDGWLDLFIGNESSGPDDEHPCELYHNNRDGTFTDVAAQAGVANAGFVKGATWGDYDNDGRPDLYLSRLSRSNVLYHNDGPVAASATTRPAETPKPFGWKFTDVTEKAGVGEPLLSFPTWFWDYDNDGWMDIFVASFSVFVTESLGPVVADYLGLPHSGEHSRLYRNNHNGTFTDVTRAVKLDKVLLAMGANFGDLDSDGYLDCYFGTGDPFLTTLVPNRMFRNSEGRFFQDVTTSGGFGHLQKGHGISFVDIDNDGDQDIYAVMGGAYSGDTFQNALFENPGFGNHWITLRLEGVRSNCSAIGARIKVVIDTEGGDRNIYATVSTGGSFGSAGLQQEIGLGRARALKSIEILWPATGQTQVFTGMGMDQIVKIREGQAEPAPVKLKPLELGGGKPAEHGAHLHHHPG